MLRQHIVMSRCTYVFFVLYLSMTVLLFSAPSVHAAQEFTATPAVIDEKGKPRDILRESIKLTNSSDHYISVFPTVEDINIENGEQTFSRANNSEDLSDSLANWIELSRGVIKLAPGEERDVSFVIRLNPNAVTGSYHAQISFSTGDTREQAEARGPLASTVVNLEVTADVKEIMQLNAFTADGIVFTGDDVLFNFQLQNIGNQELSPKGEIRIYDRKGREVAALDVNKEGKVVAPDQVAQLASMWSAVNGFGKFKALLNVSYGRGQTASVQDTVFFWIIPWKQLFALLIVSLVAVIAMALYFHRWLEDRHLGKLAHAGLLKAEALIHIPHAPVTASPPVVPPPIAPKPAAHHLPNPPSRPTNQNPAEHTIDLKQIRAARHEPEVAQSATSHGGEHGSVINLKKSQ